MTEFLATTLAALVVLVGTWGSAVTSSIRGIFRDFGARQVAIVQSSSPLPSLNPFTEPPVMSGAVEPSPIPEPSATPISTPTPTPTPSKTPAPTPKPRPKPTPSPPAGGSGPTASPSAAPTPIPSPDFAVGTIAITEYTSSQIKLGEPFAFKVFVRESNDAIVKNKTMVFVVNGVAQSSITDASGKAVLEFHNTQTPGKITLTVKLGDKTDTVTLTVLDTKPSLGHSPMGCTQEGCHIRLGNEAGEWIPNWTVTARTEADPSYLARMRTDAFGQALFALPPRTPGGVREPACLATGATTFCLCIEVENLGTKCGGF